MYLKSPDRPTHTVSDYEISFTNKAFLQFTIDPTKGDYLKKEDGNIHIFIAAKSDRVNPSEILPPVEYDVNLTNVTVVKAVLREVTDPSPEELAELFSSFVKSERRIQ